MVFPPQEPTSTFPYRIESRIGEGAMGIVYRAVEPILERTVAIKVLRQQVLDSQDPATAREYRQRFLQEARAAAALAHPGATTIYRIGEEDGLPYIAMEWLEGRTLEDHLLEAGKLSPAEAVRLGVELLATLEAAHRAGVIHRDIKPANLVLLRDGRLKVTDFGIARLQGSDLVKTQAGIVLATPRFASPEQLRGEEVDGRSDLFSVGILLYHALTGVFPFGGKDFIQVATAIFRDEPAPMCGLDPAIPESLAAVVTRALAKDREDRFPNAPEMAAALTAALSEGSRAAVPSPEATRAARLVVSDPVETLRGLPPEPWRAAVEVARRWPARELGAQATRTLLERLVDRPLHAPPFAGAAVIGKACLFLADGLVLGAANVHSGELGDGVIEALPETAAVALHPVPEALGARFVRVLASLLHPLKLRHEGLDSSFVNLPALGGKLRDEGFDGILRLTRSAASGHVLFCAGKPACALFSTGWEDLPVERPWEEWVPGVHLRADVAAPSQSLCLVSYRRELADLEIDVGREPSATERRRPGSGPLRAPVSLGSSGPGRGGGVAVADDPLYRFLRWALEEIPAYFQERDRVARWKYLVEWLAEVRLARLHHQLPQPGGKETDFFDLATFDLEGRVLHLAHRVARGTPEALEGFRNRVIRAKTARIKTGDVGGAILVARSFDEAVLASLDTGEGSAGGTGRWFGVEEAFTGYEGFVRVGPRRGFHLLLVQETEDGFLPILP